MIKAGQVKIISKPAHKRIEIKHKTRNSLIKHIEGATPKSHYIEKEQVKVSNALLLGPTLGLGAGALYSKLNKASLKKSLAVGGGLGLVLGAIAHRNKHNKKLLKEIESLRGSGFVKESNFLDANMIGSAPVGAAIKDLKSIASRFKGLIVGKKPVAKKVMPQWHEITDHGNPALSKAQRAYKEFKEAQQKNRSFGSASSNFRELLRQHGGLSAA